MRELTREQHGMVMRISLRIAAEEYRTMRKIGFRPDQAVPLAVGAAEDFKRIADGA